MRQRILNTAFSLIGISGLTGLFWQVALQKFVGWTAIQRAGIFAGTYVFFLFFVLSGKKTERAGFYTYSQRITPRIAALILTNADLYLWLRLMAENGWLPWKTLWSLSVGQILFILIWEGIGSIVFDRLYPLPEAVLVSGEDDADVDTMLQSMARRKRQYRIAACVNPEEGLPVILKEVEKFEAVLLGNVDISLQQTITKFCFEHNIRLYMLPRISDILMRSAEKVPLRETPLLVCRNAGLTLGQQAVKRTMDILLSGIGLLLTAPAWAVIALCIKLCDGGPVLYRQARLTKGGAVFQIYKFRSMIVDAEKESGAVLACRQDERITPVGRVLRRFRLDELPQFLNILKGDMSFVGPRPERPELAEKISAALPEFSYRLKVKAGLTGLAHVLGQYNTRPCDRLKMDLMYITEYSVLLDLKIILMTPKVLFIKERAEGVECRDGKG